MAKRLILLDDIEIKDARMEDLYITAVMCKLLINNDMLVPGSKRKLGFVMKEINERLLAENAYIETKALEGAVQKIREKIDRENSCIVDIREISNLKT